MYKAVKDFGAMIRVVAMHQPALLRKTHLTVAGLAAKEGDCTRAEHHYIESTRDVDNNPDASSGAWEAAAD
eukprot:gene24166-51743_t